MVIVLDYGAESCLLEPGARVKKSPCPPCSFLTNGNSLRKVMTTGEGWAIPPIFTH